MRKTFAAAILAALTLTAAPSHQQQCKNSCDIAYRFCIQTAFNKYGKKTCKANRASCKKTCPATHN
jgi:hypothetical protein